MALNFGLSRYKHSDEKEYPTPAALSIQQLNDFTASYGSVGSHTFFHPLLDRCESDVGFSECLDSRKRLEELTGKPVVHFALPNGNGNENTMVWVRRSGYHSCRTITPGWVTPKTSPFLLPCFGVSDKADIYKAAIQVCGLWDFFKILKNKLL
ncbi:polysaccharide deacetylase family protein [Desulfobacterium sp. N47]|uniref:NodB homology domain-containing protein n=1 Tax=uncultured Desulfobacterium sp. TaxID=201089 RepID=E1YKM8_9BACT|nr:hypothetical protein N47_E41730 [uncultured Desulfobacterium sp.]